MAKHKGLEFQVNAPTGFHSDFSDFDEACAFAVGRSLCGQADVHIDVICWSRAAAKAWGGDDAVESYNEDPEASVFERIQISANSEGRVP